MVKLDKEQSAAAFARYRTTDAFFPLIGAVLLDEQDGVVYADVAASPRQVYVEHAFGFAQVFGDSCLGFEADLERYLLVDRSFVAPKVRLYAGRHPAFLDDAKWDALRSFRQRFTCRSAEETETARLPTMLDVEATCVDEQNVAEIERVFGVVGRFWRGPDDFLRKARAVVGLHRGRPASICYAAAEADRRVEIDVLTLPEFRTLGIGKFVVTQFVRRCFEQSVQPLWDCFANNSGSLQLCRSVGFRAPHPPYPFFTINK